MDSVTASIQTSRNTISHRSDPGRRRSSVLSVIALEANAADFGSVAAIAKVAKDKAESAVAEAEATADAMAAMITAMKASSGNVGGKKGGQVSLSAAVENALAKEQARIEYEKNYKPPRVPLLDQLSSLRGSLDDDLHAKAKEAKTKLLAARALSGKFGGKGGRGGGGSGGGGGGVGGGYLDTGKLFATKRRASTVTSALVR